MSDHSDNPMDSYIDATLRYMREVVEPMQKTVYPTLLPQTQHSPQHDFQYQLFEFDTVTLEDSKTRTVRKQANYFVETLGESVTLEMIQIPGGSFWMGALEGDEEGASEYEQPHLVNVLPFCMGKFEVTQAQWEAIMHQNLSLNKGETLPVENVSWQDATEFCRRLSSLTGRSYRLPSEAEWEYACRAGSTTPFYFGNNLTTQLANYWDMDEEILQDGEENLQDADPPHNGVIGILQPNSVRYLQTQPVGSYPPNAFGLYDMHGNVYELCRDAWHRDYADAPTDGSAWGSGEDSKIVVIRGGSFDYYKENCRSAYRSDTQVGYRYHGTGFRVVCSTHLAFELG
jgi:formylglycine-generating enzyme required for sulfatase activity